MRSVFHARLAALDQNLASLCEQVGHALRRATEAAFTADLRLAEEVISEARDIDDEARQVTIDAAYLTAQQQPVAHDLRVLLAAQHQAVSLRRMTGLASNIAKATRRRYPRPLIPREVRDVVVDMAELAHSLTERLQRALGQADLASAHVVRAAGRQMGSLHVEMLAIVGSSAWPHDVTTAVDVCMLSRDLQRFAEHAQTIAEEVVYVATGSAPTVAH